jgi:electron transfer flavoprotein alpha/beta subunit
VAESVLGPCEEAALGTALALRAAAKERGANATVEVIAVGPAEDDEALALALGLGADAAFRVWAPALDNTDFYAIAQVLAAAVRKRRYTWIVCGDRSGDEALGATGPAVAEFLRVPHLSGARDARLEEEGTVLVRHHGVDFSRELRLAAPAVLCVAAGPALPAAAESTPAPVPAAGKRPPKKPKVLELETLGIMAEQLRHRQRFLGAADPRSSEAEILPTAEALIARLRADGLL